MSVARLRAVDGRLGLTLRGSAFSGCHAEFHEGHGLIQRVAVWPFMREVACCLVSLGPYFPQNRSFGGHMFVSWV